MIDDELVKVVGYEKLPGRQLCHRDSAAILHFRVLIISNYHHFSLNLNISSHCKKQVSASTGFGSIFCKKTVQILELSVNFSHILEHVNLASTRQVLMGGLSYGHMLTHLDLSSTSQIIFFWGGIVLNTSFKIHFHPENWGNDPI